MTRRHLILLVLLLSCDGHVKDDLFDKGEQVGHVNVKLEEASGLVASIKNEGYFWTHNDSGHPAEIFLIDEHANIKMVCQLKNIQNRDWEDIAIGQNDNKTFIYVGDIGDNKAQYPVKLIYRFEEPLLNDQSELTITNIDTLIVKLPDGVRDTEALTIDPLSNDMFLFSKREDSVRLYQLHYPYDGDTLLAERMTVLPFHNINAADISSDGQEVLIKDYDHIYYWKRVDQESIPQLVQRKATELPYDNGPQDEAIAWKRDGAGFFTLGETVKGGGGNLVLHKRK